MATILLTGAAGFIGSWTAHTLADRGDTVIGLDNFNDYYDPRLKRARAKRLEGKIRFVEADIADQAAVKKIFTENKIDQVCHLAAQAGVRYSLENPFAYETANNVGTLVLLEATRHAGVKSFIYASSSSVYGGNTKVPFSVEDNVDKPISLYAATKKYNELMAYTYHHLYGIHTTGLRFFTVYGPWGRPDMALFKFTDAILKNKPIEVYNYGKMKRDFTFVTDIVAGIIGSLDKNYPYEIFNLGNSNTVELSYFIECIEKELGKKAEKKLMELQPGDVPETYADIEHSRQKIGFSPKIKIEEGIREFVTWYKDYYKPA
jgi:UDP-glucuronate 4-epimerase